MKKIPIFLSALAVIGASAGLAGATMIDKTDAVAQHKVALWGGQDIDVAADLAMFYTNQGVEPVIANQATRYVKLSRIDPVSSRLTFEVEMPSQGWKVRSIKVYYRNYDNNITEKMADEAFALTGVEGMGDWGVKLVDRVLTPAMSAPTIGSAVKIGTLTANRTNQVYYAVEFAPTTNSTGREDWAEAESLWVKGKVDYRDCGHSSAYDAKTMSCAIRSTIDGTIYYLPEKSGTEVALPDGEVVKSWADEWREMQLERAQAAYKKMETLNYQLVNALKFIGEAETSLDKIELAVTEVGEDADGLIPYNVKITRELIAKLRTAYAALGVAGNQDELEALRQENIALKQELIALKESVVKNENVVSSPNVTYQVVETDYTNNGAHTEVSSSTTEVRTDNQDQLKTEGEAIKMTDEPEIMEAVEVPNLGEIETKNTFWWWIIPVILASGMIIYWLRKVAGRKQRD